MIPVWQSRKTGTLFEVINLDAFMLYLGRFHEGEPLEVIVRKPRKPTSTPQMRYYYGVVVKLLSDYTGHTPDEIDSILKWKFLVRTDGNGLDYVPSKKDLTTTTMEEFLDRVRVWAAISLSVTIPLPNEIEIGEDYGQEKSYGD